GGGGSVVGRHLPVERVDELLKWRDEFPILGRTTYMISNSLGAMPRGVYDKVREYAESWATRGVRAWEESWWDLASTVGDKVAALIGAPPGSVSLHQNVTTTQAVITSCFDFSGPRNKVVLVDLEFPSILYFYQEQQARGARIEIVRNADGIHIPPEKLLAAIDERRSEERRVGKEWRARWGAERVRTK